MEHGKDIKSIETEKICQMREYVQKVEPSSKEIDDYTIRRFLRARDLDIEKASAMLLKYLNWRKTFVPNSFISTSEIQNEIAQNKWFLQGTDKKGRPISVVFGARHFQNKGGLDEFKRFLVYGNDKICTRMKSGQEKFVVIADLKGWGYQNTDVRGCIAAASILQDYYPERLEKAFIVHVPYMFMAVYKLVYPFLDSKTRQKIVFVENKRTKATLLDDIDESQLPEIYGGKMPLIPIHES